MKKFSSLAKQNAYHIKVLNGEMGELRDHMKKTDRKIGLLNTKIFRKGGLCDKVDVIGDTLVEQKVDMKWIKRVGSVTAGLLGALIIQLILKGLG